VVFNDGVPVAFQHIARDITEQKNNVLKLQEYAKELEEMLKRLV